jgi:hypothetical protein
MPQIVARFDETLRLLRRRVLLLAVLTFVVASVAGAAEPVVIAGHAARFDASGHLLPWTSWTDALDREMRFYKECPVDHGYPRFVTETFLQADWTPDPARHDTIPATQNGMGIISYLKLRAWRPAHEAHYLDTARAMGDFLLRETLTPDFAAYPHFTRSTGMRGQFPLAADSGSQSDRSYEIEPDKGGIAGYALVRLFEATHERKYLDLALHLARVLAAHQQTGDDAHSPWPFRVDYRNGAARGPISGNMTYILRLYDELIALHYDELSKHRQALWQWIRRYQIPSTASGGALFAQFFEDHDATTNRSAWAPLNLARYLLEKREKLDPDWRTDTAKLVRFVRANFTHKEFGVTVCHEQDEDLDAWGGINSTYGAVLALYAKAVHSPSLASDARQALNFTIYSIDIDGRPRDLFKHPTPGGWQEDAHTDVIHNYIDALRAFPEWATSVE